jgi:S-adenosylmethionine-dependent methyltransferase
MTDNISDKNFDPYAARLRQNIYGSLKGKIRLKILLNDLDVFLKAGQAPLTILDAGCGAGQCSSVLAQHGHQLTLCDISANMIAQARGIFREKGIERADFIHTSIQEHSAQNQSGYDVILCHAVLEWAQDPRDMLEHLKKLLKPGGYLSLMFFNLNGTIFKTILRGNFYRKDIGFKFGRTKSLTPTNPLVPQTVYQWLDDLNFRVENKSGIRIFYDHCDKAVRDTLSDEQVLQSELSFSRTEPFLSMARYIHLLCRTET